MERYKAYIVDDEYLERTLLRYSIPWDTLGIEIAGEAGSGEELLQKARNQPFDIIFTDICMPYMDGLTLAQKIKETRSDAEVVILSGHRDFAYAKRAINIGVAEYLLKPIDKEELQTVLEKIKKRIQKRKRDVLEPHPQGLTDDARESGAKKESGKKYSELVAETMKIVEHSLSDGALSLHTISEVLHVNPSYLCRIFKQEAGKNLSEYIMRLRITKSLEYLDNTNLKAYEIAEKIGLNDSHYFSICFKKYTGKSIQEYRKNHLAMV